MEKKSHHRYLAARRAETLAQRRELCQHRLDLCGRAVVRHARPPPAVRHEGDEVDARPHRGDGHERVGDRIRARQLAQGLELRGIEQEHRRTAPREQRNESGLPVGGRRGAQRGEVGSEGGDGVEGAHGAAEGTLNF